MDRLSLAPFKIRLFTSTAMVCGLLFVSCSSVTSPTPVGTRPATLDAEEWNGHWRVIQPRHNDTEVSDEITFRVLPDGFGRLEASETGADKSSEAILFSFREHGDSLFASVSDSDRNEPTKYYWALAKRNESLILAWAPIPEKFAALVKEGRLPGDVVGQGTVHLGELSVSHLDLILSEKSSLFGWEEPMIYERVAK